MLCDCPGCAILWICAHPLSSLCWHLQSINLQQMKPVDHVQNQAPELRADQYGPCWYKPNCRTSPAQRNWLVLTIQHLKKPSRLCKTLCSVDEGCLSGSNSGRSCPNLPDSGMSHSASSMRTTTSAGCIAASEQPDSEAGGEATASGKDTSPETISGCFGPSSPAAHATHQDFPCC